MLVKKMLRTAWLYKAQFISMILMVMLGVGVFVGFNMEWASIEKNMFSFFDDCNFADYRLVNERGYSAEDAEKIADIEGVDSVGRFLTVNVDVKNAAGNSLRLRRILTYRRSFLQAATNTTRKARTECGFQTDTPQKTVLKKAMSYLLYTAKRKLRAK